MGAAHQIAAIYGGSKEKKDRPGDMELDEQCLGKGTVSWRIQTTAFLMSADVGRFRAMGLHEDRSQGWQTYGIMLFFSSIVIYGTLSCSENEFCMINLMPC